MWSTTLYAPLTDQTKSPDAASLLGERITVENSKETHYVVDASIDLRRVTRSDAPKQDADVMLLKIRNAHRYSAGVECWSTLPKLILKCGAGASPEMAFKECLPWLKAQAEKVAARAPALGKNVARQHQMAAADPAALLKALALTADEPPTYVAIRRRKLRSAVPSDNGALYEQSDLSAGGRLWRGLTCESTSPSTVRDAIAPVRETFSVGMALSAPQFAMMVLRTNTSVDEQKAAGGVEHQIKLGRAESENNWTLKDRLLDAWYESTDVFNQRVWRAAHDQVSQMAADDNQRLADDRKLLAAPVTAVPLANSQAASRAIGDAAAAAKAADLAVKIDAGGAYGLLALFPPSVVAKAIGGAASSGDARQLQQLLAGARGAHLNKPCGLAVGPRRTPLMCAAANGHSSCVQLLLRHAAEVSATAEGGRTALHLAAMGDTSQHATCASLLLRYGADATQPDIKGHSAIDLSPANSPVASLLAPLNHHGYKSGSRWWTAGSAPYTLLLPEWLKARDAEAEAATTEDGLMPFGPPRVVSSLQKNATHNKIGLADLPGGPLRYDFSPPPGPPPMNWVSDLLAMPQRDDATDKGAWWSMQHPMDVAALS